MAQPPNPKRDQTHIPPSLFFDKVVPMLLIGLAIISVVLIALAAGVLLGIVPS
jgi:hypothetical protein